MKPVDLLLTPDQPLKGPKFARLAKRLREEIRSGHWRAGDRLPGYAEAKSRYGVTKNTLEKTYRTLEQGGQIERINGVGTFVATSRKRSLTGTIGVFHMPSNSREDFPCHADTSYEMGLMQGVRRAALRAGVDVMLLHSHPSVGWEKVDGVLVHGDSSYLLGSVGLEMPAVSMMSSLGEGRGVTIDHAGGGRAATEHLLGLGHRRIGYMLATAAGNHASIRRLAGYDEALKAAGILPDPGWVVELENYGPMFERGRISMEKALRGDWDKWGCTALLVQNDIAAIGAMQSLTAAGISIPNEVSVMGFDGTDECDRCLPGLSSIGVPLAEIGARATDLLMQIIREDDRAGEGPWPVLLPTQLQVRGSTAPPLYRRSVTDQSAII